MTDYIKQVAEAVRNKVMAHGGRLFRPEMAAVDLGDAIASVPKPEPVGWQFFEQGRWWAGMEVNNHRANTEAAGIPVRDVYTYPPDAQAEIVRLKDEAAKHDDQLQDLQQQLDAVEKSDMLSQIEIERLNAKATEREGFIDDLLEQMRLLREAACKGAPNET